MAQGKSCSERIALAVEQSCEVFVFGDRLDYGTDCALVVVCLGVHTITRAFKFLEAIAFEGKESGEVHEVHTNVQLHNPLAGLLIFVVECLICIFLDIL